MSFTKVTTFKVDSDDIVVIDTDVLEKTAEFKLPDGVEYDPKYLYLKVKAVSAGEYWGDNKNNDFFPEAELKKSYKTFLAAHTFKNHENKKIENAIGDVLTAEWNDQMKCVYLVIRINKEVAPTIVKGYQGHYMTDVSMGCRVDHVMCPVCGKVIKKKFDYCDHLKYQKGKVMDDGTKVYEINIGPKFHDISVVLRGAERTAKVVGLYIENSKVAFNLPDGESLEKTASLHSKMSEENYVDLIFSNNDLEKVAKENENKTVVNRLVSDSMKKKEPSKDVKEAKDDIQNKLIRKKIADTAESNLNKYRDMSDVMKLLYTKYWDKKTCQQIALKLKKMAEVRNVSKDMIFDQFLKVADFAGIELTPVELNDIYCDLSNIETHDLRQLPHKAEGDVAQFARVKDMLIDKAGKGLPCVARILPIIKSLLIRNEEHGMDMENPYARIKMVIRKAPETTIEDNDSVQFDIMRDILSKFLEERSSHRRFLMPRIIKISRGEISPNTRNLEHFAPVVAMRIGSTSSEPRMLSSSIISSLLHSAYENDRVNRFNDGSLGHGVIKIASLLGEQDMLEKCAGLNDAIWYATTGVPLINAYSALQRSRMHNGERISSFNRFIAENPTQAAFAQAALIKDINSKKSPIGHFISGAKNALQEIAKYGGENEGDMFKSASINNGMKDQGYSDKDISIVKYACVLNGMDLSDSADKLLSENNLNYNDVDKYLKTSEYYLKIRLDKTASELQDSATNGMYKIPDKNLIEIVDGITLHGLFR